MAVTTSRPAPRLRPSRFNVVFADDDATGVFNTRTGAYLRLRDVDPGSLAFLGKSEAVTPIRHDPPPLDDAALAAVAPWREELCGGEFLIGEDEDEVGALKVANRAARFATDALNLTVVTTHQCNFGCDYCYEDKVQPAMEPEVQDRIADFVERQAKALDSLSVTWFGGEPLMARQVIQRLSVRLIDICLAHEIGYGADIITNGYLLTPDVAEELRDIGVSAAQITLDGVGETHDARRALLSGRPTFDRIVENICAAAEFLTISVRMNLDATNIEEARRLIDFAADRGLQERIGFSFAAIHDEGKGCRDRAEERAQNCGSCGACGNPDILPLGLFAVHHAALYEHALARGFAFGSLPQPRANACSADRANGYSIEPDGTIQKCWQTVTDPAEAIGDVFTGTKMNANHTKWLNFDPFALEKCSQCRVLPLCMGWCPQMIMADPSPRSCNVIKHSIVDELRLFHRSQAASEARQAEPVAAE